VATNSSISVLMAAKNSEATIRSAINSCLRSLGKQDELLVFLDGCEDHTETIVRSIADRRLRIFKSQKSVGRSAARNRLIDESNGEYLAIQDSDDISLPWRFFLSRRLMRRYDMVFGNGVIFGSGLRLIPFAPLYPFAIKPSIAPLILAYRNPFIHSGAMFKKSLLGDGIRYKEVPAEEYLLWIDLAQKNARMLRTRLPYVCYRIHEGQVTSSQTFSTDVATSAEIRRAQELLAHTLLEKLPNAKGHLERTDPHDLLRSMVYGKSWPMRFEETFLASLRVFLFRVAQRLSPGNSDRK